jgi:hypothetical protein
LYIVTLPIEWLCSGAVHGISYTFQAFCITVITQFFGVNSWVVIMNIHSENREDFVPNVGVGAVVLIFLIFLSFVLTTDSAGFAQAVQVEIQT